MKDKKRTRQDFKIEQETQDMTKINFDWEQTIVRFVRFRTLSHQMPFKCLHIDLGSGSDSTSDCGSGSGSGSCWDRSSRSDSDRGSDSGLVVSCQAGGGSGGWKKGGALYGFIETQSGRKIPCSHSIHPHISKETAFFPVLWGRRRVSGVLASVTGVRVVGVTNHHSAY